MPIVKTFLLLLLSGLMIQVSAASPNESEKQLIAANSKSPKGAAVYLIKPLDGETFNARDAIEVSFGLKGMGIAPAGLAFENTGHHHLLIDQKTLPNLKLPIPASNKIIHYGKGQTQTEILLEPGTHTLQLILGNQYHIPHDPPLISDKITIHVSD